MVLSGPGGATDTAGAARSGSCVCACGRHVIDEFGDHIHSCKKRTGSTKAAHETLLDALEALCFQAGIKTERRNTPSVTKSNGKIGRGDLVLKNVNLGGPTARTRIGRYREGYATRTGDTYVFLPCVMSTSGRMHGEFLRLLFIIAHRRTERWFKQMGDDYHSEDAFKFRRVLRNRPTR